MVCEVDSRDEGSADGIDVDLPNEGKPPRRFSRARAIVICIFIANTGFFHGYDNGVVSDVFTMPSFREMMGWPAHDDDKAAWEKGLTVNGFNVGAAISAVLAGHFIVDRYGRRPALMLGSWLFAAGGLIQCLAGASWTLVIGRLVAGVGVGITSSAGPAYIAEVAPSRIRGTMVGVYQSNVCLAIAGASVLNYVDHGVPMGWRLSLGVQVVLGCVTAVGIVFCTETPRFLQSQGRGSEALEVLTALRGGDEVAARRELAVVQAELEEEREAGSATWGEVFTNPHFRNVVILGCFVQFFQIITGINAMVSYGGTLFETLGVAGLASALAPPLFFLLGNSIGSFLLVDRIGRRSLLIWGMVSMAATLVAGGTVALAATQADGSIGKGPGGAIIAMVVGYMFSFGISWGFGAWLYISEIMPLRVRGKAVGLCTATNWGPANVISAFITPVMIAGPMGPGGTLLFFGCISAMVVPFAVFCLPETKGRSLEEITPMLRVASWAELRSFLRGNVRHGAGMAAAVPTSEDCSSDENPASASASASD